MYKKDPADTSLKEDLSIDTAFDPSWFSWDTTFNAYKCTWYRIPAVGYV